ncbi:uncharacterized protein LOC133731945 [Rosa rugosa]|uniref:uncharacterized protein LOC133731945 n=1 Tax=Rosa rugosa TaxID=74645 RepID=UPI002B40F8FB|nr:uncharacterized protein LOC133731945 [Rosa rugosa]
MDMSTLQPLYYCNAVQFSGVAQEGKRLWIRARTAPIHYRLLKLIHSCRRWIDPSGVDMVPIRVKLYQQTVTVRWDEFCRGLSFDEPKWVTERRFIVPVSDFKELSKLGGYRKIVAGYLSSMRVPEDEQEAIIQEIFWAIYHAVPGFPIIVRILQLTLQVANNAITSYIEGLERVRVDSLEEANRHTTCAICTEDLDHFEGIDNDEQMIIRLPCLHLYHGDCIVPWLERCLDCPLCRQFMPFLMPIVQEANSSSKPSGLLRWPTLLMMSAGGIITATLLCRLLKRT